jgi:hypothetical protein
MKYIIYAIQVVINLIGVVLTYPLALLIVLFKSDQAGWCDNGTRWATEPRLQQWLSAWQTPDNSLYGDQTFQQTHSHTWWGYVQWLWRNPFYGFAVKYLHGTEGMTYAGDINCDATHVGTIRVNGQGLWQYNSYQPIFGKMICFNFGHNIRALVDPAYINDPVNKDFIANFPAIFAFTIRFAS